MGKVFFTIALMVVLVLGATNVYAQAAVLWDWQYDSANFIIGPSETAILNATLYNSSDSISNLVRSDLSWASYSPSQNANLYSFNWGPNGSFWQQFNGLDLTPGESFGFVFGIMTPLTSPMADGMVVQANTTVGMRSYGSLARPMQFMVGQAQKIPGDNVIPEPITALLLTSGFMGLGLFRPKKRS